MSPVLTVDRVNTAADRVTRHYEDTCCCCVALRAVAGGDAAAARCVYRHRMDGAAQFSADTVPSLIEASASAFVVGCAVDGVVVAAARFAVAGDVMRWLAPPVVVAEGGALGEIASAAYQRVATSVCDAAPSVDCDDEDLRSACVYVVVVDGVVVVQQLSVAAFAAASIALDAAVTDVVD